MADSIDKSLEAIVAYYVDKADKDFLTSMDYAVDELHREVKNMYDSLITQFYSYKTTSYIRHWEQRPGTMKGSNLYYGLHIKKRHSSGMAYLYWEINGDDMAGGYQWDTPEGVLKSVMEGGRGPLMIPWSGYYAGKYFSYKGIPEDIFKSFDNTYEDILTPIFMKKWRSLGWI